MEARVAQIGRLQSIERDPNHERQRRKILYQGRSWEEEAEGVLCHLKPYSPHKPPVCLGKHPSPLMGRQEAHEILTLLTTVEEKVAQLCFLKTEAIYDPTVERSVACLLQVWQMGGLLFCQGEPLRERYLIERYQSLSKLPLFFAHDLCLASLGEREEDFPSFQEEVAALIEGNRKSNVHIQCFGFCPEGICHHAPHLSAGLCQAGMLVATLCHPEASIQEEKKQGELWGMEEGKACQRRHTLRFYPVRTLPATPEEFLHAYRQAADVFLIEEEDVSAWIHGLCQLVRTERISEEELDKRVLHLLSLKRIHGLF